MKAQGLRNTCVATAMMLHVLPAELRTGSGASEEASHPVRPASRSGAKCTVPAAAAGGSLYRILLWYLSVEGSEAATREVTARSWDHAQLVHAQWIHAAMIGIDMHVVRVPTDDNIADLPSSESYALVEQLGGWWTRPDLHESFTQLDSFEALSFR